MPRTLPSSATLSTNYFDTFIEVVEDCPIDAAQVPTPKNGKLKHLKAMRASRA